jgi:N-glycosylase/DNA lyase
MKELLKIVENLKKSEVKILVDNRIEEFKRMKEKSNNEIFKELCFCILTANFNAEKAIKIQEELGDEFLILPKLELAKKLSDMGYRYPNTRTKYIVEARKFKESIKEIIDSFEDEDELREWLVENIKGIGYKEASHFLRNIGYTNFAIVDFHIVNLLVRFGLIEKPKRLTKSEYLKIERLLEKIAKKLDSNLAELDLYLWYIETGKILK